MNMAWETDNDVNFKCHLRQGNKSLNTLCRHGLVKKVFTWYIK